jgi:hypothetical protein
MPRGAPPKNGLPGPTSAVVVIGMKPQLRPIVTVPQEPPLKGLAVLEMDHAVQTPAVGQLAQAAGPVRELIHVVPGEPPPDIEIGIALFEARLRALGRLGRVGREVRSIAGVIDRVRPDEVRRGS